MANSNLAYDLSVYEPKPVKKQEPKTLPAQNAKPEIKVKTNAQVDRSGISALGVFVKAAVILGILFAVLYGNVETNRLFNEITKLQNELNSLQAENISLAAEYESVTSLKNVEDYAEDVLGLKKLDKAQIEYVEMEGDKVIEIVEPADTNIFVAIRNWWNEVCEYIGA